MFRFMSAPTEPSAEFLALFRAQADADERMDFARFMALALYAPGVGYYRRGQPRIGFGQGTDFFTASSSGPVFGELVACACAELLGAAAAQATFVEIGNETPGGILAGVPHPFAGVRTLPLGEPIELSGACVVFSNELFDAQPFRRFAFRDGAWRELGVAFRGGRLVETELETAPPDELPTLAPEGYVIDAPIAAAALAGQIAAQPWTGLFVAFDYGKSWRELTEACPAGTARAYHAHQQSNDLLARPGEQDLTCHVCWDWIAAALTKHGFAAPALDSQEAFLIRHAQSAIAAISTSEAAHYSRKKLSLLQLLHPSHLGQKFQVLHARR
ncbi:protein of unknown function DUF185 [Opitutus terrae PB90-1]|uniref:Uncharacterized protein n=2 Tax=Opitutus terrae TaxID=107709 RepID=B1ZYG1_OPITP|nr:protein of unknown function DUF185 [Opitutus terrae PB90-1]